MSYAIIPVLSLLLMFFLAGAALPFAMLAERRRAVTRRRSLYEKSADQIGSLTCLVQALPAFAVAADLLAGGLVSGLSPDPWRALWWLAAAGSALGALLSAPGLALCRSGHRSAGLALAWLSGLCSTAAAACAAGLVWAFARGAAPGAGAMPGIVILNLARSVISPVLYSADPGLTALFALTCLTLAPASALGLGLVWQTLRRGADDFGRDYYTVTMGARARRASCWGALLLLFSGLLMWMSPAFSPARLPWILPPALTGGEGARTAIWIFGFACLGLPAAVLCWYLVARSAVPLRRKTLIFPAPLLLWLGLWGLLARLWL